MYEPAKFRLFFGVDEKQDTPFSEDDTVDVEALAKCLITGASDLDIHIKSNYTNMAQLKELMTAPPMSAEQHAAINRKRIKDRRMIEEAKERKTDNNNLF